MSTNSDRHQAQLFVENKIGCNSTADLANMVQQFEEYTIGHQDASSLLEALRADGDALFQKGIQTIVQALAALDASHESWALIKLYYATYFLLRESLALDSVAFLRCRNIYTLKVAVGEKPFKRSGKNYRGDHQATIKLYSDQFDGRDILLSQKIDDLVSYDWLRDKRDWINYRRRNFIDGLGEKGFTSESVSFADQVKTYCSDDVPIFCFDPEYAALALPMKRAQFSICHRGPDGLATLDKWIAAAKKAGMRTSSGEALLQSIS